MVNDMSMTFKMTCVTCTINDPLGSRPSHMFNSTITSQLDVVIAIIAAIQQDNKQEYLVIVTQAKSCRVQ